MGPDEWHYPVNNSCYTNSIARVCLRIPGDVFPKSARLKDEWKYIADNMYIPFDEQMQYHPQHDGYDPLKNDSDSAEGKPGKYYS